MGYSTKELELAWRANKRLGTWDGKPVYACSHYEATHNIDNENYYIVFDDENALVHAGKQYGKVSVSGNVEEFRWPKQYVVAGASESMTVPQETTAEAATTQTSASVDEVLAHAREMTVESLLDGLELFASLELPEV